MTELKSEHLWPLVEQLATADTSDPENTVPGWVALAMLDDLRLCCRAAAQPDELERLRDEVARLQDALMQSEMDHLIRDTYGTPAPQAQGVSVPVEIADILRPLVNEVHWARYGSEDDEQRAALVRYWLDAQPQAVENNENTQF